MNGGLSSQCSSRCESGWTMYLNHSGSPNHCKRSSDFVDEGGFFGEEYKAKEEEVEEEEEEDLSMVSDASSGPPHFHEDEDYCDENGCSCFSSSTAALAKKSGKRQKIKDQHQQKQEHHPSLLDDTASSPLFSFSKINNQQAAVMENVLDFSQGFSATHFKGRSTFQKHFGFLESSLPGTNFNKTSGLQQGRK